MVDASSLLMKIASRVELFQGLGRIALERLLSRAERVSKEEGELFFDEGEDGASFYVLLLGEARVEKKRGAQWVPLVTLKPGESFGEMTLVGDKIRSARVRACSEAVSLCINNRALDNDHEILAALYRNIAKLTTRRLRGFNGELAEFRAARQAPEIVPPTVSDRIDEDDDR
jgi:CRP/FNR family cyclic AMP-dependent transcriptional regulator